MKSIKSKKFSKNIIFFALFGFISFLYFWLFVQKNRYCKIPYIGEVRDSSIIIIGHAYGSLQKSKLRGDRNISPKIIEFYKANEDKIKSLIFSGDVLNTPSKEKWEEFYSLFSKNKKIYISPGNHDVGDSLNSDRRQIFLSINHRSNIHKIFPFKIYDDKSLFIIDNSNFNNEPLVKLKKILKPTDLDYENIFIIRHHVLAKSLEKYANGKSTKLVSKKQLENFSRKNITFIYGDGGLKESPNNIKCLKIGESKHILNGIGDNENEVILVINKNKLFLKRF